MNAPTGIAARVGYDRRACALGDRSTASTSFVRRLVRHRLRGLVDGGVTVIADGRAQRFGDVRGLQATIVVVDPRFWSSLVRGGALGAAEAWIAGWWTSPDLTRLVRVLARNRAALSAVDRGGVLARILLGLGSLTHRHSRRGSRANIRAHYDIGDDLFAAMLDGRMLYSSAVYPHAAADLASAGTHKLELLCRGLALSAGDHLLEIGSGWGGLAIYAAGRYGCRVTTCTLSDHQYRTTRQRVAAAGCGDRVEVLLCDYRDLSGNYSKLVSVEMVEAIGAAQYRTFFATCARLLHDDGLAMLQAITIADQRYDQARRRLDFIKRRIFPGGCLPSVTALCRAATAASDLRLVDQHDYTPHYAHTLMQWRDRFQSHRHELERAGYDRRFARMWEYYLCYCAGGFAERAISVVQQRWAKPDWRDPVHDWWPETRS